MLRHMEMPQDADRIEKALITTLAAGIKTPDLGGTAGTKAFAAAVAGRL